MRKAGSLLAKAFVEVFSMIKPGVKTIEIDQRFEEILRSNGGRPAFKGYRGGNYTPFPATVCISIDEEVVHGIPSHRQLKEGQIVGVDAGVELNGWYADMAGSFLIGKVDDNIIRLWNATRESLYKGIEQARKGNTVADIGSAVQQHIEEQGLSVIRDLVGHGIGSNLHEEPAVPNYRTREGLPIVLKAGMTLAIEPMVASGSYRIHVLPDGWTAATRDGSPTAHFEHTILVTDGEPEILTRLQDGRDPWRLNDQSPEL